MTFPYEVTLSVTTQGPTSPVNDYHKSLVPGDTTPNPQTLGFLSLDHGPKERWVFPLAIFMQTFSCISPLPISFVYSFILLNSCHVLRTAAGTGDLITNKGNSHLMELTGQWERQSNKPWEWANRLPWVWVLGLEQQWREHMQAPSLHRTLENPHLTLDQPESTCKYLQSSLQWHFLPHSYSDILSYVKAESGSL